MSRQNDFPPLSPLSSRNSEMTEERTVFVSQQLKVPTVPNFIVVDGKFVQPGNPGHPQELPKIDIKDLSDQTLEAIADAWKASLLDMAKQRRDPKLPTPR